MASNTFFGANGSCLSTDTGEGAAVSGKTVDNKDAKTTLNYFVQRFSGRMLLKGDVVYKSGKVSGTDMYQATVQLFCLDGAPVFAGELCREKKSAEQEAAKQALAAYDDEVSKMYDDPMTFKKARLKEKEDLKVFYKENNEMLKGCKQKLFELLGKHLMRPMHVGKDIYYQTKRQPEQSMYITVLTLPGLHGEWATKEFVGDIERGNGNAQGSACKKALEALEAAPEFEDAFQRYNSMIARNDSRRSLGETDVDMIMKECQKDPKPFLQSFIEKLAQKPLEKGDIVYTSIQVKSEIANEFAYQATVQMCCLPEEPSFAGELAQTQESAELNAARAALESFAEEISDWDGRMKKKREREEEKAAARPVEVPREEKKARLAQMFPYKGKLLELVMKIVRKAVTKEDISWVTDKDSTGKYICTLKAPVLPGHWSRRTWKGLPYDTVKEAELSTSQKCFDQIRVDPMFASQVAMLEGGKKVTPKREATPQSVKARGKGIDLRRGTYVGPGGGRDREPDIRKRDGPDSITMLW
eukprot:TRINITY_DN3916_c0_g3_i1.p1 TRINITY_DN3916_c0_g3~~TRINITY_DN3916_c0_g3_i1.p1  ORF type:complete len:528 (+),score=137.64 TRINITY_DN3916_c0_g3_i1:75-1658(+)